MTTPRAAAIAAGLDRYQTGKPCKNGHDGPRYTASGTCVACVAVSTAKIRTGMAQARALNARPFTYLLHPDDHAAALAVCQGLDLQRGRVPGVSVSPLPAPLEAPPDTRRYATVEEVRHERDVRLGGLPPVPTPPPPTFKP